MANSGRLVFWAPKSLQMVTAAMKLKDTYSLEAVMTNLNSMLKKRDQKKAETLLCQQRSIESRLWFF